MDSSSDSQCVSEADLVEMFPDPWFTTLFSKSCCPPHRFNNLLLFLKFLEGKYKKILEKECNRMFLKHGFSLLQKN